MNEYENAGTDQTSAPAREKGAGVYFSLTLPLRFSLGIGTDISGIHFSFLLYNFFSNSICFSNPNQKISMCVYKNIGKYSLWLSTYLHAAFDCEQRIESQECAQ